MPVVRQTSTLSGRPVTRPRRRVDLVLPPTSERVPLRYVALTIVQAAQKFWGVARRAREPERSRRASLARERRVHSDNDREWVATHQRRPQSANESDLPLAAR